MVGRALGPKLSGLLEPVRSRTGSGSGLGLILGRGVNLGGSRTLGTLLVDGTCEVVGFRLNLLGSLPLPAVGLVMVTSCGGASVSASGSSYSYS